MRPSLGVLINYHNEGKFLTECLDTLLSGPERPDEILVYDDASTDPAEPYVRKSHPVRIVRGEENIGIGRARNELMKVSQSDFIHFQDADDFFHPAWCASVRKSIGLGEADVILSNVSVVNAQNTEVLVDRFYDFRELLSSKDLLFFFLAKSNFILVAMTTFRRKSGLSVGGFLPREILNTTEDFEFHMRLFAPGPKFEVIEDSLVIKRRRPNSLSRDGRVELRPEVFSDGIKSLSLIREWLPPQYHQYLPDIFYRRGAGLFRSGRRYEARLAFRMAQREGGPTYRKEPETYRFIAKTFGPEFAEWAVFFYSKLRAPIRTYGARK